MPRYYTYRPGSKRPGATKANTLRLGANQHVGYDPGQGYFAAAGKPRRMPRTAAPKPIDVEAVINNYFRGAMLTPEQQRKAARTEVESALADQMKAFERERAKARQENDARQMTAVGLAAAMQGMKGADADQIRQAWSQAGGDMASFASALSGSLQAAQQGAMATSQGDLNRFSGGQLIAPSPEANASVANYVGGTLPAATAQRNAEAQYQAAMERGDASAARFWDQQRAIEYEGVQQEGEMASAFRDIEAQRPKLLREATAAQQARAREELATLMSVLNVQSGLQKAATDQEIARGKLGVSREANRIREEQNKRTAALTRQRNAAWANDARRRADIAAQNAATARGKALGVDPVSGTPLPGFKFDKTGRVVKDEAQKDQWAKTVKVEQDFRKFVTKWFKDNYVDKDLGRPRASKRPPTKAQLVSQIMGAMGNTLVGKNGLTKEAVQMWASQVLNSFPNAWWNPQFYKPRAGARAATGGADPLA